MNEEYKFIYTNRIIIKRDSMLTAPYNEMHMYGGGQHQMDLGNYDALNEYSAANTGGNTHRLLEAIE